MSSSASDTETTRQKNSEEGRRLGQPTPAVKLRTLVLVVSLFGVALALSMGISRGLTAMLDVGDPGTVSRLFASVTALQLVGFGGVTVAFLAARGEDWLSYLRVGRVTQWDLFYGAAVGLSLMVLTVVATVLFTLLDIEPAEAAVGQAEEPQFYLVLFVVSTAVVVPLEEVFFRGILQRSLVDVFHPAIAIGVASLLFAAVHTGVSVGDGGELLALSLFVAFGVVLGVSYHLTENLLVPIIGHAMFNGIQILVRAIDMLG